MWETDTPFSNKGDILIDFLSSYGIILLLMLVTRKETLIATLSPDGHDDDKRRGKNWERAKR